jgi:hypothetical protein
MSGLLDRCTDWLTDPRTSTRQVLLAFAAVLLAAAAVVVIPLLARAI